jgi:drug/metabolite transporter (DMT)-like permease
MSIAERDIRRLVPAGAGSALTAALLFGVSTPLAKLLLGDVSPVLLAALFYLGSGIGLSLIFAVGRQREVKSEAPLGRKQIPSLAMAVFFGGVLAPALLMFGLSTAPASEASLLLNLESVFTVLLAWFVFRENFDARIALGMLFILAGGGLLSFQGGMSAMPSMGSLAIIGACLCWGIDNNFTQKVSASNPVQVAAIKGIVAGFVNLIIAFMLGAAFPAVPRIASSLIVGFLGYGVSLVMFLQALRRTGTARTSAYFSTAPFIGALVSVMLLKEPFGLPLLGSGVLMAVGVWLHLTERHQHEHTHEVVIHTHRHVHDEHHQHEHSPGTDLSEPHSHAHRHEALTHSHLHYPDIHHRHPH